MCHFKSCVFRIFHCDGRILKTQTSMLSHGTLMTESIDRKSVGGLGQAKGTDGKQESCTVAVALRDGFGNVALLSAYDLARAVYALKVAD